MRRKVFLFLCLLGVTLGIQETPSSVAQSRTPKKISAYAPPGVYGPQVVVVNHIGAMTILITAKPLGNTNVVGEVEYWETESKKTTKRFFGSVKIKVAKVVGSVRVRMKSLSPLGSAVELSISP